MIKGIHHTAISTADMSRALQFYCDLLGFEKVIEMEWPKGTEVADQISGLKDSAAKVAMLRAGNMMIEIFEYTSPAPKKMELRRPVCDHGFTHLALEVTDIQSEYERLKAAGMIFHCPPQDLGLAKSTYGRDPDGNVIELQETAPNAPIANL